MPCIQGGKFLDKYDYAIGVPVKSPASTLLTLTMAADSLQFIVKLSPGVFDWALICPFDYKSNPCTSFQPLKARGYLHARVLNKGKQPASYSVQVRPPRCSTWAAIAVYVAQRIFCSCQVQNGRRQSTTLHGPGLTLLRAAAQVKCTSGIIDPPALVVSDLAPGQGVTIPALEIIVAENTASIDRSCTLYLIDANVGGRSPAVGPFANTRF
jgi:hypothetical protein